MHELIVSLVIGTLANALWFAIERVIEVIMTRENPPCDDEEA